MLTSLSRPVLTTLVAVALAVGACGSTDPTSSSGVRARSATGLPATDLPAAEPPVDLAIVDADRLDPDLLAAVQAAARDARADGITVQVTSGWRSREHQQRLYDEAVTRYGSEEEARRYVATPDASAHVTGDAVDIGPTDAADWMGRHGSAHGLCQTFANEMWHFELATTPGGECPEQLPDGSSRP
ncbi:M15 family metallopeptidase [Nocardioides lianchengensis]|uniref:D-alanyl-D-alanine carboxypeptidase n=1 Tax=Nocardioides lianchengensis TaxID=1045774 RepID=A0A1G6SGF3_9ACTN|nr:M15 family metallopeptidase [Nocardioides lianchengensis]NYG09813.1 sugar/nucleoside kinase (ribokinase family) [Nocardioides lianchengensis]SDD15237.1 D-alanyl-D-alanine carboxypeptidase [Nocardioides lianchengensis]